MVQGRELVGIKQQSQQHTNLKHKSAQLSMHMIHRTMPQGSSVKSGSHAIRGPAASTTAASIPMNAWWAVEHSTTL